MTNKEAIEKLKELLFMTGYKEAHYLAIKALKIVDRLKNADCESDLMIIKADVADMRGGQDNDPN